MNNALDFARIKYGRNFRDLTHKERVAVYEEFENTIIAEVRQKHVPIVYFPYGEYRRFCKITGYTDHFLTLQEYEHTETDKLPDTPIHLIPHWDRPTKRKPFRIKRGWRSHRSGCYHRFDPSIPEVAKAFY